MYLGLLVAHNLLRAAVLLAGLWVVARGLKGQAGAARAYVALLLIELAVGGVLLLVSPLTQAAFSNPAALQAPEIRFFALLHPLGTALAAGFGWVGLSPRWGRRAWAWQAASLLALLASVPWWRPLLRLG